MTTPISSLAGHTRRPRVGVDFHAFDGPAQGCRTHLLGMYREAVRRAPEYDFVFFCAGPEALRAADPAFALANVQCVAMPRRSSVARLGWQLAWLRLRHRIDLLHLQDRLPLLPFGPCVVTLHDTLFETHPQRFTKTLRRLLRLAGRRALRRAALLLATSEFSRREIARLYDIDPLAITLTANGVDTALFRPVLAGHGAGRADADLVRGRPAARGLEVAAGLRWDAAAKALLGSFRRFFAGRNVLRADS
jgi:glycosyltransferase involved in cell wall biosynthesis